MFATPAYAQAAGAAAGGGTEALLIQFLPLVALVVLFYFLMIRPQQRRAKQHQATLAALKRGDVKREWLDEEKTLCMYVPVKGNFKKILDDYNEFKKLGGELKEE